MGFGTENGGHARQKGSEWRGRHEVGPGRIGHPQEGLTFHSFGPNCLASTKTPRVGNHNKLSGSWWSGGRDECVCSCVKWFARLKKGSPLAPLSGFKSHFSSTRTDLKNILARKPPINLPPPRINRVKKIWFKGRCL